MQVLQPQGWAAPKGYSNGIAATGRQVYVAGQIGWTAEAEIVSDDFAAQTRQALENTIAILREAGAGPQHIVRMTWFVTDKKEYMEAGRAIGAAYKEVIGRHYPAMTLVQVAALLEDRAKVEIETTAVVPD